MRHKLFILCILAGLASLVNAQRALSGDTLIREEVKTLGSVGSVMMIGAHPDDENTALLAWLARGRHVRTAYLALTRGEGGQNLIGSEQGDEMGVIRTQELLAARRIDGAEQFFTRAIDFGFTKSADETLSTKWPRDKVLGDVVWNIRRFRPDVIILRFTGTPRDGHGHHQASAILGKEAVVAAADPNRFPEQLKYVQPWQTKRLMQNIAAFNNQQEKEAANTPARVEVDLGEYSPELGYSYGEIAGMSRSQHRSQGMGSAERKGAQKNYLITLSGDTAKKDIFDGIDISWGRLKGGAAIGTQVGQVLEQLSPGHPELALSALAKIRPSIAAIDDPLAKRKLVDLDELMALCAGLSFEAQADKFSVTPGANLKVNVTAISRVQTPATLTGIQLKGMQGAPAVNLAPAVLAYNQTSQYSTTFKVPADQPYSGPYWLEEPKEGALYSVKDPRNIGNADNAPVLEASFHVRVAGTDLELTRPVQHRYIDRVYGELVRPLAIVPPVAVSLDQPSLVFPDGKPKHVDVQVKSNASKQGGEVHLELPAGWKADPPTRHFELGATDEQTSVEFDLTPPAVAPGAATVGKVKAVAAVGERQVGVGIELITYPHIPVQTLFPPAESTLVRADVKTLSKKIGYVMGAGDDVPEALRQIGCDVMLLTSEDLSRGDLTRFDAVVTGVRAWNLRPDLRANYQRLYDYAQKGGTVVVQYNTPEGGQGPGPTGAPPTESTILAHMGPYPIQLSRNDRVTVEEAPVAFPNPKISLLQAPNKITQSDFDGWIQERGLYFADKWDAKYQTVLESHDPGEMPLPGGMLFTRLGKGAYVFTAYSWFRELPAGVPGAYRIFANILSAGKVQ